jgi:hypothetical protein
MERIILRSDGTYAILAETLGTLAPEIVRDDGRGFSTFEEAQACLNWIKDRLSGQS